MEKEIIEFRKICEDAVEISRQTLRQILKENADTEYGKKQGFSKIDDLKDYKKLPLTDYDDYKEDVIRMMQGEENVLTAYPVKYFLTSSGSSKQKLIPMTQTGLNRGFDVFYGVSLPNDPAWEMSKHLHTSMVRTDENDKVTFLSCAHFLNERKNIPGFFDKFVGGETFMFTKEIGNVWYVKLWLALAEPELKSMYSIYQYDILLLLQYFKEHWNEILQDMEQKSIPEEIEISQSIREKLLEVPLPDAKWFSHVRKECEKGFEGIVKRIWKNCCMVNGIGGQVFGTQGKVLKYYLGDIAVHYFAYASSEAPIGIAMEAEDDSYVFIPHSCFVEFLELEDDEDVKWIDELEVGKKYELVITNFCGFYRYRLLDVVEVIGFYGASPILRFAFRKNQAVNIAGEKTNMGMIADTIREAAEQFGEHIEEHSICVDETVMPNRYCFFLEGDLKGEKEAYQNFLDQALCEKNRDYEDLRQLGQVAAPICVSVEAGSHAAWKTEQGMGGHSKPLQFSDASDFQKFMMERERKIENAR